MHRISNNLSSQISQIKYPLLAVFHKIIKSVIINILKPSMENFSSENLGTSQKHSQVRTGPDV